MNKKNIIMTIASVLILTCLLAFARTTTTDLGLVKPTWLEEDPEYDILVDLNANSDILEAFANDVLEFDLSPVLRANLDISTFNIEGVDATEFGYLDGVTSDIQTQLSAKIEATLTEEQVEDYVGGMLGGTETLISVDYQDDTNDIDFVVTIPEDHITATMLIDDNAPADEDIYCYESTGPTGHWYSRGEVGIGTATSITDDLIVKADFADEDWGDMTVSTNVVTIDADAVTYAKIQNVTATNKVLGRSTAGAGIIEEITCTSAGRDLMDDADTSTQRTTLGLVIGTDVEVDLSNEAGLYAVLSDVDLFLEDVVDDTTPELGGELDAGAHSIGFTQQTVSYNATTTTVNWTLGNKATVTLTGNVGTMAFTNPSNPCNVLLKIVQDATGSRLVTAWDADIKWVGGTAPTLTTTANGIDICSFYWDGTNYFGVASLAFATP